MTRTRPEPDVAALDTLERSFQLLCRGPHPLALDGRTLPAGLPRRRMRLTELRELLLWPGKVGYPAREAVWAQLVTRAQSGEPAWTVAAGGVCLPGLRGMHARLCYRHTRLAEDIAAAMLAGFLTRLRTIDPHAGRLPARLCWAAYRAGLRLRDGEDAYTAVCVTGLDGLDEAVAPPTPYAHPDMLLAHAVTGGLLTAAEAEVIGQTRIGGHTLAQVANQSGESKHAVTKRRQRAEARLVAALRTGALSRHGYWPTTTSRVCTGTDIGSDTAAVPTTPADPASGRRDEQAVCAADVRVAA